MGNPNLHPASFPRNDRRAPPATQVPPMFPEMRQCAVCKLCVELRPAPTTTEQMVAICDWRGTWWFALQGCDRWQFDRTLLGDEGLN